jgi:hypothetical protein
LHKCKSFNNQYFVEAKMELTSRETWTVLHGMVLGALYLLAFGGAVASLYSFVPSLITPEGMRERIHRMRWGFWVMAAASWATVIVGTWGVYIWYRAVPVAGEALSHFPRSFLLANESTKDWHEFGMEWKEHVAWIAPLLATSIAYSVQMYGEKIANDRRMRNLLLALLVISFMAAAVAGVFGAFINKVAATR